MPVKHKEFNFNAHFSSIDYSLSVPNALPYPVFTKLLGVRKTYTEVREEKSSSVCDIEEA